MCLAVCRVFTLRCRAKRGPCVRTSPTAAGFAVNLLSGTKHGSFRMIFAGLFYAHYCRCQARQAKNALELAVQRRQASALKLQKWIRGGSGRRRASEMRRLLQATRMVQKAVRCGLTSALRRFCCSTCLTEPCVAFPRVRCVASSRSKSFGVGLLLCVADEVVSRRGQSKG